MVTLFRKNLVTLEEAEAQLAEVGKDTAALRRLLDDLRTKTELDAALEGQLLKATSLLARLQGRLEQIEAIDDFVLKSELVQVLVDRITVDT